MHPSFKRGIRLFPGHYGAAVELTPESKVSLDITIYYLPLASTHLVYPSSLLSLFSQFIYDIYFVLAAVRCHYATVNCNTSSFHLVKRLSVIHYILP